MEISAIERPRTEIRGKASSTVLDGWITIAEISIQTVIIFHLTRELGVPVETLVGNGLSSPGSIQSWHKLICDNKARESGVSGGGGGGMKIVSPLSPREGLILSPVMAEMCDSLPRFKKRLPVGYIPVVVLDYQSTVSCTITRGL